MGIALVGTLWRGILCTLCLLSPCLAKAQLGGNLLVPPPNGYRLGKRELKDLLFQVEALTGETISQAMLPLFSFIRETDTEIVLKTLIKNRAATSFPKPVGTATSWWFGSSESGKDFATHTGLVIEAMEKEWAEGARQTGKDGVKVVSLGREKLSERSYILGAKSNVVDKKTKKVDENRGYYYYFGFIHYKESMYCLRLSVPLSKSENPAALKQIMKGWITEFYVRNGAI